MRFLFLSRTLFYRIQTNAEQQKMCSRPLLWLIYIFILISKHRVHRDAETLPIKYLSDDKNKLNIFIRRYFIVKAPSTKGKIFLNRRKKERKVHFASKKCLLCQKKSGIDATTKQNRATSQQQQQYQQTASAYEKCKMKNKITETRREKEKKKISFHIAI